MPSRDCNTRTTWRSRPAAVSRALACSLLVAACVVSTGCRSNKKYDLIEAELRTRERELAETRAALDQARAMNQMLGQGGCPAPAAGAPAVTTGAAGYGIQHIDLARGTGGVDDDAIPGDESLMVVIVPSDRDKSAVKIPAQASIAAFEINQQGLKTPIGSWEISPEQLRRTWRSGLLATGYFVPLAWQRYPCTERVRIAVRLVTASGQAFEADRDVTVRPGPQVHLPAAPAPVPGYPVRPSPAAPAPVPGPREPLLPGAPPPGVPPVLPPGVEELPPPSGLNTGRGAKLLAPVPH